MPWLLLLLLLLMVPAGPTSARESAAKHLTLTRGRRQVTMEDDYDEEYEEYQTEPPETFTVVSVVSGVMTMGGHQRAGSVQPGSPEPPTVAARIEPVTQQSLVTEDLASPRSSVTVSSTEAPFKKGALSMQPAATEAETTQPVPTEAETSEPAPTEAETSEPAEAMLTSFTAIKALSTELSATEPIATVAMSTETDTTEFSATEPTPTVTFLGHSVIQKDSTVAASNLSGSGLKKGPAVPTGNSMSPSPTEASGHIPVRQCLLAILILALVATIFLVCTVVLAVRLSRKGHMYPVRNYSPTEMVCISSLLPDGGEGASATANGGVSKGQDLKAEDREDREGDNLTLHSFLP
ncbi:P-selectin glycoprotein ligand 1 isoform X1 [Octodon degus]|uniref:P-selectin glycoprotein ligand 1 isoform X1 n=1 Tax=Octodon degus TaxID=10160 RepID=A0A6P6EXC9_OCTDE|nr:P-selectin glycoprotein ligand 1 isoform X1 [Octodon degus]